MPRLLFLALTLMGLSASGATASISFSCTILRSCDNAGICIDSARTVQFNFEPVDVKAGGEGVYRLRIGGVDTEAYFVSEFGPVVWSRGASDVQTLIFTGRQSMVWTNSEFDNPARSQTRFLKCEDQ